MPVHTRYLLHRQAALALVALVVFPFPGAAQQPDAPTPKITPKAVLSTSHQADSTQSTNASASPLLLTLQDALARAKQNSTDFQGAVTDAAIAAEDRKQAR